MSKRAEMYKNRKIEFRKTQEISFRTQRATDKKYVILNNKTIEDLLKADYAIKFVLIPDVDQLEWIGSAIQYLSTRIPEWQEEFLSATWEEKTKLLMIISAFLWENNILIYINNFAVCRIGKETGFTKKNPIKM